MSDQPRKNWTREEINEKLHTSAAAVERAMVVLFLLQNEDEQVEAQTKVHNMRGFTKHAAVAGTRFARWILGYNDKNKKVYTPKGLNHPTATRIFESHCKGSETVMDRARRIALLHSRQLVDVANGKVVLPKLPHERG